MPLLRIQNKYLWRIYQIIYREHISYYPLIIGVYELISDDARWLLFMYATKIKGVKYSELGISRAYGNMIKNRKRSITNELLERILEKLTAKDLLVVLYSVKELGIGFKEDMRARRLAWLGRRPDEAEVRGSNPRGPIIFSHWCMCDGAWS